MDKSDDLNLESTSSKKVLQCHICNIFHTTVLDEVGPTWRIRSNEPLPRLALIQD